MEGRTLSGLMVVLLLFLAGQFPTASDTSWMEPPAFHLELGLSRSEVEKSFARRGWILQKEGENGLVHDFQEDKAVVLEFRHERLASIRFELVSFLPALQKNWTEVVKRLHEQFGKPDFEHESLLVTENDHMSIHAVLEHRPDSELGRQGAGRIIVRYFVPSDVTGSRDTSR